MTDPTLASEGQSTLYALLPLTHESEHVNWSRETARFRDLTIQQMQRIGIKDVELRIRACPSVTSEPVGTASRVG